MLNESNAKNVQCVASNYREQKVGAHLPALEGRGRGGVFDSKVILAFIPYNVFSAPGCGHGLLA